MGTDAAPRVDTFTRAEMIRHELERTSWEHDLALAVIHAVGPAFEPDNVSPTMRPDWAVQVALACLQTDPQVAESLRRAHRWSISAKAMIHEVKLLHENPDRAR